VSEPITWQALLQFQSAIKLIEISRGYHTDLGLGVVALEGDQLPEAEEAHTVILATELPANEDASATSVISGDMEVVIEFSVPFAATENAQLLAHRARADVIRAVIGLKRRIREMPFRLNRIAITGSRIGQPEDGASVVIAQVTARAGLTESFAPASP
jgi:hypothetical protein